MKAKTKKPSARREWRMWIVVTNRGALDSVWRTKAQAIGFIGAVKTLKAKRALVIEDE